MEQDPFYVVIVDDEPGCRDTLASLVESAGYATRTYASAAQYLREATTDVPSCLLLDVLLPEMDGLACQRALAERGAHTPIIFLSGHADVPMCAHAMKAGAIEFLTKPVRPHELLDAIHRARLFDRHSRAKRNELRSFAQRVRTLSSRERDVLMLVTDGHLNKEIASRLGISEPTVKLHRSTVMRKMAADSLANLVRMRVSLEEWFDWDDVQTSVDTRLRPLAN